MCQRTTTAQKEMNAWRILPPPSLFLEEYLIQSVQQVLFIQRLTCIFQTINEAFDNDPKIAHNNTDRLLLTAAVGVTEWRVHNSYNITALAEYDTILSYKELFFFLNIQTIVPDTAKHCSEVNFNNRQTFYSTYTTIQYNAHVLGYSI